MELSYDEYCLCFLMGNVVVAQVKYFGCWYTNSILNKGAFFLGKDI